jgi:hypothetical protein
VADGGVDGDAGEQVVHVWSVPQPLAGAFAADQPLHGGDNFDGHHHGQVHAAVGGVVLRRGLRGGLILVVVDELLDALAASAPWDNGWCRGM